MKKIFTIVAAMLTTIGLMATQHEVEDANGLSWWTAEANVNDGDTLVFTADTIEWAYDITLPCALTFINKEGVNPVLVMPAKFNVSHALEVKGLTFIGNGGNDVFRFTAGTGYSAKFDGCTFKNFHYAIRVYDAAVQLEQLTINNCLFDGFDASAICTVKGNTAPGTVKNVSITNSTIMNGGSSYAIYICDNDVSASTDGPSVTIDHCTLYNNATNSYTIYLYKIGPQAHISNCVVANPSTSQASYAYYGYDGNFVDNCVWYNCSSGARSGSVKTNLTNADPKFVSAATGDFNWLSDSPLKGAATDGSNIGDPRWKEAAGSLTFTFLTPAAAENAMNDYIIKFNVLNPSAAAATVKIAYSYDNAAWTNIYTGAYNDTTACTFATRGLEEGNIYLRGAIVLDDNSDSSVVVNQFLTIVKDTQAPRAIANFEAAAENTSATLTWQNPTHNVPVSGSLLGEEDLLEGASIYGETATMEVENNTVKVTATAAAWAQVGISFDATAFENVQNVAFKVKGDPAVQLDVFVVQNGYDWWHKAFYPTEDWMVFDNNEWSKVTWHNNNPAETFDGNDVTNVMITIDNSVAVENSVYYLDSVMVNGTIAPSQYFEKTIIRRSEVDYPASITDGDAIYEGNAETTTDIIDPTKNYYYTAFAVDDIMNVSEPTHLLIEAKEDPTALHRVNAQTNIHKVLKQNHIFILRDNKAFNVLGQPR